MLPHWLQTTPPPQFGTWITLICFVRNSPHVTLCFLNQRHTHTSHPLGMNHTPSILCSYGPNAELTEEVGNQLYFVMPAMNAHGTPAELSFFLSFILLPPIQPHPTLPALPVCLLAAFPPPAAAMLPPRTRTCYGICPASPVTYNSQNWLVTGQKPCLSSPRLPDLRSCERHGEFRDFRTADATALKG